MEEDMVTNKTIKGFMFGHFNEHLDDANCLNMTSLAEDAAAALGDDDDETPEVYFELAFEVQSTLRRQGRINS